MSESLTVTERKINHLYHRFSSRARTFGKARALGQELPRSRDDVKVPPQSKNETFPLGEISPGEHLISSDTYWCLSSDLFLRIPRLGWLVSSSMFDNFPLTTF